MKYATAIILIMVLSNNVVEHRSGFHNQKFVVNDSSISAWSASGAPGGTATVDAADGIVGLSSSVDSSYLNLTVEIWDTTLSTYKGLALITAVSSGAITFKSLGNPRATDNIALALADNDVCLVIGNAFGEGTEAPDAFADELQVVYNSTQIFKTAVEITGTLYEAALRGYSNELARLRGEKSKEHKMQMNQTLLKGARANGIGSTDLAGDNTSTDSFATHVTDANGKTVRTTMGVIPAIYKYGTTSGDSQNIFTVVKNEYGYKNFVEDTEKLFQYVPADGVKKAVCGMGPLSYFSTLSGGEGFMKNSKWKVQMSEWKTNKLGFNIRILESPHGMIELAYDPALRGQYKDAMVIYDEDNLDVVQYRPMKYQTNIKTDNGYDGIKDQYFADMGLGITLIEAHSVWNFR
jgi:hypothetical protein